MNDRARVGVVVIGRNEGERLVRCLASLPLGEVCVVVVDSGSSDDSVAHAQRAGAEVVELDPATPFTAARARNEGLDRLRAVRPGTELVQFVDGDCELVDGWLDDGVAALDAEPAVAVVAGAVAERDADASVFHRLAAIEWAQPPGDVEAVGGILMARIDPVVDAGGFDASLIAGEEPDLCRRLRADGWVIRRVDRPMCTHDLGTFGLAQWWRRSRRSGHTTAEGALRAGGGVDRSHLRSTASNLAWGLGVPGLAFGLAPPTRGRSLVLLALPVALAARVARRATHLDRSDAALHGAAVAAGKVPEAVGAVACLVGRLRRRPARLIEYK